MSSLAYFHSFDIFHLLSINPLTMFKGQLEQWVTEQNPDSLQRVSLWFPSSRLSVIWRFSSPHFIKQAQARKSLPVQTQSYRGAIKCNWNPERWLAPINKTSEFKDILDLSGSLGLTIHYGSHLWLVEHLKRNKVAARDDFPSKGTYLASRMARLLHFDELRI